MPRFSVMAQHVRKPHAATLGTVSTTLHRHDTKQQARSGSLVHITHLEALAASVEAWSVNTFTATVCTPPMVALYTCTAQHHVDGSQQLDFSISVHGLTILR